MSTNKNKSMMNPYNKGGLVQQHFDVPAYAKVEKVYYSLDNIDFIVSNIKTIEEVVNNIEAINFVLEHYDDIATSQTLMASVLQIINNYNTLREEINTLDNKVSNQDEQLKKQVTQNTKDINFLVTNQNKIEEEVFQCKASVNDAHTSIISLENKLSDLQRKIESIGEIQDISQLVNTQKIQTPLIQLQSADKDKSIDITYIDDDVVIGDTAVLDNLNNSLKVKNNEVDSLINFKKGLLINDEKPLVASDINASKLVKKLPISLLNGCRDYRVYLMQDGTIKSVGRSINYSNGDRLNNRALPNKVCPELNNLVFKDIYVTHFSNYALTEDGEVWSWGDNSWGQLGHGNTTHICFPKKIAYFYDNNIKIKKIYPSTTGYPVNDVCTYFLTDIGEVYAVGANTNGNLGNGNTTQQTIPVKCGTLKNIVDMYISARPFTCAAIDAKGNLYTWGWNGFGALGLGDTIDKSTPILNSTISNVKKICTVSGYDANSANPTHATLALLEDGTLWACGRNEYGVLGQNNTVNSSAFVQIKINDLKFKDISLCGGRVQTCAALTVDGDVYTWGYNAKGQCGLGNTVQQNYPQKVNLNFKVDKIQHGGGHGNTSLYILNEEQNILCATGYSSNGNLGTGSVAEINTTFNQVLGVNKKIKDFKVYGHSNTTFGLGILYIDGTVDVCGYNEFGELGCMTPPLHNSPVLSTVLF